MTRVVYWNSIPSPYMVDRFNAVAARGNVELEAWFSARTHPQRSWAVDESQWRFPHRYLPRVAGFPLPTPLLTASPDLLVMLYGEPAYVVGFALARLRRIRTAFWCEVTFDDWFPRAGVKERAKRAMFPRVDGVITVGRDGAEWAMRYGAADAKIHYAPHTIDAAHFRDAAARADRDGLRRSLGLEGTVFVYVGRLWEGKGLDTLLDAFAQVEEPASLLLVGEGPERAALERRARGRVVFAPFQQHDRLPAYYAAADVFVFPTLGDPYGLVVDEAMAAGLPVVSSSAAGELYLRVVDGETGLVVPPRDTDALAGALRRLARDPELRARLATAAAARVADSSPDRWARDFEQAVAAIVA